jgi:hypothetical protein
MVVCGLSELVLEKWERKADAGEKPPERLDSVGEGGTAPGSEKMAGELARGRPVMDGRGAAWCANKACLDAAGGVNEEEDGVVVSPIADRGGEVRLEPAAAKLLN